MATKSKVLLVDDSKFLRMANECVLSKAGYEVSTAADGEEALRIASEQLPDIILLDMMLPKVSGVEVLRALKKNPATANIPVIVLSSLSQVNEGKLIAEGAAAYFEKAALDLDKSSDRLTATVKAVLEQAAHKRSGASRGKYPPPRKLPPPTESRKRLATGGSRRLRNSVIARMIRTQE